MPPPTASGNDVKADNDLHTIGLREMVEDFTQLQLMTQTLTAIMNMHRLMFGMRGRFVIYLILAPSTG